MERERMAITLPLAIVNNQQSNIRQKGKVLQIYHEHNCSEKSREIFSVFLNILFKEVKPIHKIFFKILFFVVPDNFRNSKLSETELPHTYPPERRPGREVNFSLQLWLLWLFQVYFFFRQIPFPQKLLYQELLNHAINVKMKNLLYRGSTHRKKHAGSVSFYDS